MRVIMYCCACGKDLSSCVKERRSFDGDARGPLEPRKSVISLWKELSSVLQASNTASAPGKICRTCFEKTTKYSLLKEELLNKLSVALDKGSMTLEPASCLSQTETPKSRKRRPTYSLRTSGPSRKRIQDNSTFILASATSSPRVTVCC